MRTFHLTWMAFFLCFFGWFGVAPLMAIVRDELHLTKAQIGNTIIASVAITVVARIAAGWLCDRIGPRKTYTVLLIGGSIPVMLIGLARDYQTFLLFRLAIGAIGASFVITQYHTSVMFAPEVVGTANAMTAGWGNLGGGATQIVMPLLFGCFLSAGLTPFWGWRLSMAVVGAAMLVMGVFYFRVTQDDPGGNLSPEMRRNRQQSTNGAFLSALKDRGVWALFLLYGACFGIELTIDNIAALYFHDSFHLNIQAAGVMAGTFGMMNLFARALGGYTSDRLFSRYGFRGRIRLLTCTILLEGVALMMFSRLHTLSLAIALLLGVGLFVKMSNGATYAIVPFIKKDGLGAVAGIVGAGGNTVAVAAGFLFKAEGISWSEALLICGLFVSAASLCTFALPETAARQELPSETTVSALESSAAAKMEETCLLADYEFSA
jgi:NNP family nitrate/nitrite transporter-like MFS transporter